MKTIKKFALILLASMACAAATSGQQSLIWSDNFDDNNNAGWNQSETGSLAAINQQFVVSGSLGPYQVANPLATHVGAFHPIPATGSLPDRWTLEMRADLVAANQSRGLAGLHFLWMNENLYGYLLFKGENEVALVKFWNAAGSFAWFFYQTNQLKNQNVTLVLALTRNGANLGINARVLDKDNANAVLFDHTVTDTPQADPVVYPSEFKADSDLAGMPYSSAGGPTDVELTLTWLGPQSASVQVIYDNLEVRQYESPPLAIQNAVILSWPLTQEQFILESAPAVNGAWTQVPDPWWRTNATRIEVSIPAPDNLRLFRLQRVP